MASAARTSAHMVGSAFVTQYYNVLHQYPQLVFRFYTDASSVIRADTGTDGIAKSGKGQAEIHELIMSDVKEGVRVEIVTIDSQDSFSGSVLVVVTGVLHKNNEKQKFVQSFFLAPQERGFFVLNDILRYLDQDIQAVKAMPISGKDNQLPAADMSREMPTACESILVSMKEEDDAVVLSENIHDGTMSAGEEAHAEEAQSFRAIESVAVDRIKDLAPVASDLSFDTLTVNDHIYVNNYSTNKQTFMTCEPSSSSFEDSNVGKKSYASILRAQRDFHTTAEAQTASSAAHSFHPAVEKFQETSRSFEAAITDIAPAREASRSVNFMKS